MTEIRRRGLPAYGVVRRAKGESVAMRPHPPALRAMALVLAAAAIQGAAPAPPDLPKSGFVTAPPELPALTRTREQLPIELMNRVLGPLPADAPRPSADPRDIEGLWTNSEPHSARIRTTMTGRLVPFNRDGARVITERVDADNAGSPIANAQTSCRPPGALKQLDLNFPFRILQTAGEIDFVFEEFHALWQVRMNQPRRIPAKREYSGDSIGHWDGATLVIENSGFKLPLWLDTAGAPLSPDGKITYRMRKIEGGRAMEIIATIDDPKYYTEPWSVARRMVWRPDRFLAEYNCEDQIGDESGDSQYGISQGAKP